MRSYMLAACLSAAAVLTSHGFAAQINIDFDDLTPGVYAGDAINDCVVFTSYRSNAVNPLSPGDEVQLFNPADGIRIDEFTDSAVSDPNYVLPIDGLFDVLMDFSANPITGIALTTDEFIEGPETVNLIALALNDNPATAEVEYTVVAVDSGLDDATSAPDNRLFLETTIDMPFSLILFQGGYNAGNPSGRELEGFDDLRFVKDGSPLDPFGDPEVPEPSTLVLVALAMGGGLLVKRQMA